MRGGSFYAGYDALRAIERFWHAGATEHHEEFGLRVASVFQPDGIPVVSEWGMVVVTLLVLTVGTLVFRMERQVFIGRAH